MILHRKVLQWNLRYCKSQFFKFLTLMVSFFWWININFCGLWASLMAQWQRICLQCRRGFDPWVRKMPWRRKCQPTPVFLPEKSQGQRSLVGYRPWGHKELEATEHTCPMAYISMHACYVTSAIHSILI